MDSTFTRALLGFTLLTSALAGMALFALWGIAQYGGGSSWAAIIVVLLALIAEIGIYSTTLHEPIYKWIREPAERRHRRDLDIEHFDDRINNVVRGTEGMHQRIAALEKQAAARAV